MMIFEDQMRRELRAFSFTAVKLDLGVTIHDAFRSALSVHFFLYPDMGQSVEKLEAAPHEARSVGVTEEGKPCLRGLHSPEIRVLRGLLESLKAADRDVSACENLDLAVDRLQVSLDHFVSVRDDFESQFLPRLRLDGAPKEPASQQRASIAPWSQSIAEAQTQLRASLREFLNEAQRSICLGWEWSEDPRGES